MKSKSSSQRQKEKKMLSTRAAYSPSPSGQVIKPIQVFTRARITVKLLREVTKFPNGRSYKDKGWFAIIDTNSQRTTIGAPTKSKLIKQIGEEIW